MSENINWKNHNWRGYYKVVVFVVWPTRQFLLFRKLYGTRALVKLNNYLIEKNRKPIYFVVTFKDGYTLNIKSSQI